MPALRLLTWEWAGGMLSPAALPDQGRGCHYCCGSSLSRKLSKLCKISSWETSCLTSPSFPQHGTSREILSLRRPPFQQCGQREEVWCLSLTTHSLSLTASQGGWVGPGPLRALRQEKCSSPLPHNIGILSGAYFYLVKPICQGSVHVCSLSL